MRILQLVKEAFFNGIDRLKARHADPVQMTREEVDAFLAARVKAKGEPLDVAHSVVDLLKALDLDSSMDARIELARELGYQGPIEDTERMNNALHALLMKDLYAHKFKGD